MTQQPIPLSVLDLSPVPAGGTSTDALRNTIDLAQAAERAGYHRFWVAEHHLAEGVASSAPAVLVALIAGATDRIRVGSGAVQLPNSPPLLVVEQFGTIAALHPDRVDLGLGRFDLHKILSRRTGGASSGKPSGPPDVPERVVDGLVLPGAELRRRQVQPPRGSTRVSVDQPFQGLHGKIHRPGDGQPDREEVHHPWIATGGIGPEACQQGLALTLPGPPEPVQDSVVRDADQNPGPVQGNRHAASDRRFPHSSKNTTQA